MTKQSDIEKSRMVEMFDNLNADKYPLKEYKHIGARVPRRIDGPPKASGKADYCMDIQLPGMLYLRFLDSPYPHAKIAKMDTSKAEKLAGVRYILRHDDPEMPEAVSLGMLPGFFGTDHKPLPGLAYFEGQPVGAAVAADTEAIAEEALSLIDIEWEQRPFNLEVIAASDPSMPLSCPERYSDGNYWNRGLLDIMEKGNIKEGFKQADKIVEFKISRGGHTWVGPECQCGIFKWNSDSPEVWIKNQRAHWPKRQIARWFNIPLNKVQIHVPYQGASFGGWVAIEWNLGGLYCAGMVAKRTGRPVKYTLTRREDFYGGSMDQGIYFVKVGFKNDGLITAIDATAYLVNTIWPFFHPTLHFAENTRIKNMLGQSKSIWVNKGPTVPVRCEMLPTCLTMASVFGRVAAELDMDPSEVAIKNDGADEKDMEELDEEKKQRGFELRDSLKECIEKGKAEFKWDEKWHKPGARKLPNGRMHGVGFGWTQEWSDSLGGGEMAIRIERGDGTATILSMGVDNGVDAESTLCSIAADELGFRLEDVYYNSHYDPGFVRMSLGSSTNLSANGWAVRHTARILKQKILESVTSPTAATQRGSYQPAFPDTKPEELDIKDSIIFLKSDPSVQMPVAEYVKQGGPIGPITTTEALGARGAFTEPLYAIGYHVQEGGYNPVSPRPRLCRQAHFMEVEVDTETGEIFVTKIVNANDVGKAINPMSCEGQLYGGSIMGVSRAKFEEVIHDPVTGVMLNGNLIDYKVATTLDTGPVTPVIIETGMGYGPYGAVGIGEDTGTMIPGLLAPAVFNAIGAWIYDYPITPDKVLKALGKI